MIKWPWSKKVEHEVQVVVVDEDEPIEQEDYYPGIIIDEEMARNIFNDSILRQHAAMQQRATFEPYYLQSRWINRNFGRMI